MGAVRKWGSVRAIAACLVTLAVAVSGAGLSSGAAAAAAVPAVAATGPGTVVPAQMFGIHVISSSNPNLPSGSVRMALLPSWREVEGIRGHYDWRKFDGVLSLYESWGFTDILYCIGGTPLWAAGTPVPGFENIAEVGGKGAAYPPANIADYQAYVRAVATRYKGRIATYETWNEPTTPQFYRGTPAMMAEMTRVAYSTVKQVDPSARVTSGSVQTHSSYYASFALPYFRELAKRSWPVDSMAGHFYPARDRFMDARYEQLVKMRDDLKALGMPASRELWDTEVNLPPHNGPQATPAQGASAVVRDYLDTLRAGYNRSYWFMATDYFYDFLTVQMREGDAARTAMRDVASKLIGSTFTGCTTMGYFVSCGFTRGDERFAYSWADQGTIVAQLPSAQQVCPVYGSCYSGTGAITLTGVPVLTQDRLTSTKAVPTQPGTPVVTPIGGGIARLDWVAPRSPGSKPIAGYRVEYQVDRETVWRTAIVNTWSAVPNVIVPGLSPNKPYQFRVTALSSVGASQPSGTSRMWLLRTPPWAVRSLTARYLSPGQTRVSWLPPLNDGGTTARYWVRLSVRNSTTQFGTWSYAAVPGTTLTGLRRGSLYRVEVRSFSAFGLGPVVGYNFVQAG